MKSIKRIVKKNKLNTKSKMTRKHKMKGGNGNTFVNRIFLLIERENSKIESNNNQTIKKELYNNMLSVIMLLLATLDEKKFDLVKILSDIKTFLIARNSYNSNNILIRELSKNNNVKFTKYKEEQTNFNILREIYQTDTINQVIQDIEKEKDSKQRNQSVIRIISNVIMRYIPQTSKKNDLVKEALYELYTSLDTLPIGSRESRDTLRYKISSITNEQLEKNKQFLIDFSEERRQKRTQKELLLKIAELEQKEMKAMQEMKARQAIQQQKPETLEEQIKKIEIEIKGLEIQEFVNQDTGNTRDYISEITKLTVKLKTLKEQLNTASSGYGSF